MKDTSRRRGSMWLMAVFALCALSMTAGDAMPQESDTAADLITLGTLEAELGHSKSAAGVFAAAAKEPSATENQRGEALVRLGAVRQATGDVPDKELMRQGVPDSIEAFEQAAKIEDAEVRRLLTLAVSGVVPGPDRWNKIWREVRLMIDRSDKCNPKPRIAWPHVTPPARGCFTGHPVSMAFVGADIWDLFRLFADISGLNVIVWPGMTNSPMTIIQTEKPWDQVLSEIIRSLGYAYELKGNVLMIAKPEDMPAPREYAGKPVNLDIRDEPPTSLFRRFEKLGNVKIQADPDVMGKTTVMFHEVPWDQALHVILATNGLDYQRDGDVIRVVKRNRDQ